MFRNLSQRVRVGMFVLRNKCAEDTGGRAIVTTHVSPKTRGGSGKLTVKLQWEVVGSQAVKRYLVMDLGPGLSCVVSSHNIQTELAIQQDINTNT